MKQSFAAHEKTVAEMAAASPESETPETQLAVTPPKTLAVDRPALPQSEFLEGEFSMSDIQLPRINLVGKTSALVSKTVPAGVYVLDKDTIIGDGETPFQMAVLHMSKEYWEKLPQGSTDRAKVFKTLNEVRAVNGTISYAVHPGETQFQECAKVICVIKSAEAKPNFDFKNDGSFFALATMFLGGTAYTNAGKQMVTDIARRPKGALPTFYNVTAAIKSNAQGSWYTPILRKTLDVVPADLLEQLKALFL